MGPSLGPLCIYSWWLFRGPDYIYTVHLCQRVVSCSVWLDGASNAIVVSPGGAERGPPRCRASRQQNQKPLRSRQNWRHYRGLMKYIEIGTATRGPGEGLEPLSFRTPGRWGLSPILSPGRWAPMKYIEIGPATGSPLSRFQFISSGSISY